LESEILFRDKIAAVLELDMSADVLVQALLRLAEVEAVCILDSCGVGYMGSHLLIAGINPLDVDEIGRPDVCRTLSRLDQITADTEIAAIFTISYEFGKKLLGIGEPSEDLAEPDLFLTRFDVLIIHDYKNGRTVLTGNRNSSGSVRGKLLSASTMHDVLDDVPDVPDVDVASNLTRAEYTANIETILEQIREGNTYQTNLTQQLTVKLPRETTPGLIFRRLRQRHPAPFSAFIKRASSTVISASPERFIHIDLEKQRISTSPVKGTRPRGQNPGEDNALIDELLTSSKDRAENVMIVDLLRNDLGRVCDYGNVEVERLCEIETHPTFHQLVSTVSGKLRNEVLVSDVMRAVYPCGSITGAPKISTMKLIDQLETAERGLSMGAIGYYVPGSVFGMPATIDMSVAIRTMVIRNGEARFNVGGGVTIKSDPNEEYDESLTKATALLSSINGRLC
jgi:para-aminobenzoate synthetase component I